MNLEEFKIQTAKKFNLNLQSLDQHTNKLIYVLFKYFSQPEKLTYYELRRCQNTFNRQLKKKFKSTDNHSLMKLMSLDEANKKRVLKEKVVVRDLMNENNFKKIFAILLEIQNEIEDLSAISLNNICEIYKLNQNKFKNLSYNFSVNTLIDFFDFSQEKREELKNQYHEYNRKLEEERRLQKQKEEEEKYLLANEKIKQNYLEVFESIINEQPLTYEHFKKCYSLNSDKVKELFGFALTINGFCHHFKIENEIKEILLQEQEAEIEKNKQEKLAEKKWHSELIHSSELYSRLEPMGVKKSEFDKWRSDNRIPTSATKDFRKWGQYLSATYHHPNDFAHINCDMIQKWREQDKAVTQKRRKEGAAQAKKKRQETLNLKKFIKNVEKASISVEGNFFYKNFTIPYKIEELTYLGEFSLKAHNRIDTFSVEELQLKEKEIIQYFSDIKIDTIENHLNLLIKNAFAKLSHNLTIEEKTIIVENINKCFSSELPYDGIEKELNVNISNSLHFIKKLKETVKAREVLQLEKYEESFPIARNLNREFKLYLGPTNSGKTYQAIEALKQATSGVYLAPLRLLAMEIYDKLNQAGIPCNLMTGEEHIQISGAKHTASTIEMCNMNQLVEVAVIDEVQMLDDKARGAAWTAAIVGVPAKEVYCVGSSNIETNVISLLDYLKERYEINHLERQCPLIVENKVMKSYHEIKSGDVLIAFSRKEVLNHANNLKDLGYSVSTIYGALAPEVRRIQAQKFLNGQTSCLVATDAIGMGLNLPAKRVIFTTTEKFDGIQTRSLNVSEIKQIAGRAGRYGLHDEGYVTAFSRSDLNHIEQSLKSELPKLNEKLSIMPSIWHVEKLSHVLNTQNLTTILSYFANKLKINHGLFKTSDLEQIIEVSSYVERRLFDASLEDKFIFSCIPMSPNKANELEYLNKLIAAKRNNKEEKLFGLPSWIHADGANYLYEAEELTKKLTMYAWLSYKYSQIFNDIKKIDSHRKHLSDYIVKALSKNTRKNAYVHWENY